MIDRRRFLMLLGLLTGPMWGGMLANAQRQPPIVIDHEYEYKAAYLYHFARLCTWPGQQDTPLVVGVLGPNRFGRQLDRIERQSERLDRRIVTRTLAEMPEDLGELSECDILFVSIGRGWEERLRAALNALEDSATLVFTEVDDPRFARVPRDGVAVNFFIENNLLKLLLNLDAVAATGVQVPEELRNLRSVTLQRSDAANAP
jgi:hypothetical protein